MKSVLSPHTHTASEWEKKNYLNHSIAALAFDGKQWSDDWLAFPLKTFFTSDGRGSAAFKAYPLHIPSDDSGIHKANASLKSFESELNTFTCERFSEKGVRELRELIHGAIDYSEQQSNGIESINAVYGFP